MSNPQGIFSSDVNVTLKQHWGSLSTVLDVARVSTDSERHIRTDAANKGLNRSLIRQKHGVPYETIGFTFCIEAPIFVIRQLVKHRMASMNELSARYSEMPLRFYIPDPDRAMFQTGRPMEYNFHRAENVKEYEIQKIFTQQLKSICILAAETYDEAIENGISKEIARTVLPVNVYTRVYFTINGRSLMNLLRLRTESSRATTPSHPQYEIQLVADKMEEIFKELHPDIHQAWDEYGRESI